MTVNELSAYVAGHALVATATDRAVENIRIDSRTVRPGDAYVAIPGNRWHGMDFENEAARAGAVVIISDRPSTVLPSVLVDDPRQVIGPLCAWFYGTSPNDPRVFGVTGTNGKTSTAHFLEAGLSAAGETAGLISGTHIRGPGCDWVPERTTPEATTLHQTLAAFRQSGVTACAMEVSSHAIDQRRIGGITYRVMAFTNLAPDHLDYHGTIENYYATKASMFESERTDIAVVNVADTYGRRLAAASGAPVWTCGSQNPAADVYADNIICDASGSRFDVHSPAGRVGMRLQTMGAFQVENALTALTALIADGVDLGSAAEGMSSLPAIAGRCQPVHAGQTFTAVVDYMHNTAGQRALLPYLRSLTDGRIIVVAGATGGRDPNKRRPLGAYAGTHADVVIVTDESPEDEDPAAIRSAVLSGARQARHARVIEEPDRRTAIDRAVTLAGPADAVVVAGRGSDPIQRFGARTVPFDDHAQLWQAIAATMCVR
ncbi:UDP-N-acetylmuramoyl-L-alanyl-D-glutamate--2,6-diaminopimelate ligase [Williamsia soli]|uniref:UDP-N-acetylmuramoyl-L-alanyl-D-glutamate--2, 6-diaminopimelate ligase n=1 Tax=Williamsia soli TaxID=364929 RepID=UPI0027DCA722|nr:UDP-N-acetylmuramoyl-L-alanyl-D-glutamate--2,6-diaminopimelate ligase [Williamsia soli]